MTHGFCRKSDCLDGIISVFVYRSVVKSIIKNVKYHFVREALTEMFKDAPAALARFQRAIALKKTPVLLPVPLHSLKKRKRGFNQSTEIARIISEKTGIPINENIVTRTKNTISQTTCSSVSERRQNMSGVFALAQNLTKIPENIIIIDDVYTTGATIQEIAGLLKRSGAAWVYSFTIAR